MNSRKTISLANLRKARGLSQKSLANEIGLSTGIIGMYETGKRKPSLDTALKIAKYFDMPVENISFTKKK